MIFQDLYYVLAISFLILTLTITVHRFLLSPYLDLPFGISLSFTLTFIVGVYAAFHTSFETSLLPSVFVIGYIFFRRITFNNKKLFDNPNVHVFFIFSYLFHLAIIFLLYLIKHQISIIENNYLTIHFDYPFYLNKILTVKKIGIETVLDVNLYPYPSPYHFYDLWFFDLFNLIPYSFTSIFSSLYYL